MAGNLTAERMLNALKRLDELLAGQPMNEPLVLIVGGGGAMILAHGFPLATSDLDAAPKGGLELGEVDPLVKKVASEQSLPPDWLNPYFSSFAHTLPESYGERLIEVFAGAHLRALALGREDLLIMKCFAHRNKDIGHARALLKRGADVDFVEKHIEWLKSKRIPGAQDALDFLDEVRELG